MALNWKSISSAHVTEALKIIAAQRPVDRSKGIVVLYGNRRLPAKEVLSVAYRLANGLPHNATVKFSSGDGTINVLMRLGFEAERMQSPIPPSAKI